MTPRYKRREAVYDAAFAVAFIHYATKHYNSKVGVGAGEDAHFAAVHAVTQWEKRNPEPSV